jgi:serine/threonine protein kinase
MSEPLARGTQLGPYEIDDMIGAGGMGQVYRAHDPRLGRHVAIKTLSGSGAADPEGVRRFETEARAAGTLAVVLLILASRVVVGLRHARRALRASREQRDRFDRDNLERLLRHLLVAGFDGGWMMLEDRSSRLRVQYKKYMRLDGEIGLEQAFPRAA